MSLAHEVRTLDTGAVAARESRAIGGYALKFNTRSQDLGGFVETIDPGFLAQSERDGWPDVMARWNHDDAYLLGTTAAGTLRLAVDGTGLDYTVDVPTARDDVLELVARGDVRQSSFAFITLEDDWRIDSDGRPLRTLLAGKLIDVAPVNMPAYLDTSTGLRSLARAKDVDVAEVRELARRNELGRLLARKSSVRTARARLSLTYKH